MEAKCDPRSFPFQIVHKAYQRGSFHFRLFDAGPEFAGLSLPPCQVFFFLLYPAFLHEDVLADLAVLVAPAHALVMGQFRSACLSRAPLSGALLFHITPFPVSTSIVNSLKVAHCVFVNVSVLKRPWPLAAHLFSCLVWLPKMSTATARGSSQTKSHMSLCPGMKEAETRSTAGSTHCF
jgi:hypothetical protein